MQHTSCVPTLFCSFNVKTLHATVFCLFVSFWTLRVWICLCVVRTSRRSVWHDHIPAITTFSCTSYMRFKYVVQSRKNKMASIKHNCLCCFVVFNALLCPHEPLSINTKIPSFFLSLTEPERGTNCAGAYETFWGKRFQKDLNIKNLKFLFSFLTLVFWSDCYGRASISWRLL